MQYWDDRFQKGGKIWGDIPSQSANIALKYFESRDIKNVLVLGAGYGRNTKLFSDNGFEVVGIEISSIAIKIAREFDKKTLFIEKSILDLEFSDQYFDAVYSFNTLHLFLFGDRIRFIKNCYNLLKKKGFIFTVVFSENENSFGNGKKIEANTFESKPGRPVHYFSEEDLIEHFKYFKIINLGQIEDEENHGDIGHHVHALRYIFAQKN